MLAALAAVVSGCSGPHLTVTSDGDQSDFSPGDGFCRIEPAGGHCTLRAAIEEANALGGMLSIVFDLPVGHTNININDPLPNIKVRMTIDGTTQTGYDGVTPVIQINGKNSSGLAMPIFTSLAGSDLTLKGLEITKAHGTGIVASGKLTVDRLLVEENDQRGIGFSSETQPLEIRHSIIRGGKGLGITVDGTVTVEDTAITGNGLTGIDALGGNVTLDGVTVKGNGAQTDYLAASGGMTYWGGGQLTIRNSTFSSNVSTTSTWSAGGLWIKAGSAVVENTIFNGNQGSLGGGVGIGQGQLHLDGCTLINNIGGEAGGIYVDPEGELWLEGGTRIGKTGQGNTATGGENRWGGGIFAFGNVHLSDSYVENNSGFGIQIESPSDIRTLNLDASTVSRNTSGGVWATSAQIHASGSAVEENGGDGIAMTGGSIGFQNGEVSHNGGFGLLLERVMLQMSGSSVDWNAQDGIRILSNVSEILLPSSIAGSKVRNNLRTGIHVERIWLDVQTSLLQGNQKGGLAAVLSILRLSETAVADNASTEKGGGVFGDQLSDSIIERSIISDNQATTGGGGIHIQGTESSLLRIVNSTLSGNATSGTGGGLSAASGRVELNNTTVTANSAANGGGIVNQTSLTVSNSIIAGNGGGNCQTAQPILSGGHNLEDAATCGFSAPGDLSSTMPGLLPLADNGGPTQTHALDPYSPARDAGDDALCEATDQRGVVRPQGLHCDIGAFESESPALATPTATPAGLTFDPVEYSANPIYQSGKTCSPKETVVRVKVIPAELVQSVGLFYRLESKTGDRAGGWGGGLAMIPEGGGWYRMTLIADEIPGIREWREEAILAIQFVANGAGGEILARSPVHRELSMDFCPR